ncbi:cytochrome P450 [Umezawaea endophytica]|uniref:Cytochrome P450 n=1 Tax=Umezawaea endophytica TaxID=1654476 RepID=A0A9X2VWT7_9PSEU|nr:cytochrome P450 [Umezawaea endophytica]MCS7483592.1 cytochrome P450 [Umezawaea endophytica]
MTKPGTRPDAPSRPLVDFDHHSADFRERNHEIMDDLRSRCPVAYTESHGGFWVLTDYRSVAAALRDDELFSSCPSVGIPPSPIPTAILPAETDPPLTGELRAITARHFSRTAVQAAEEGIREMAGDLVDAFVERGECDVVAELATPLPARVILAMLDFDQDRWAEWVDCVHAVLHDRNSDPEKAAEAAGKIFTTISEEMERRTTDGLGGDLLSSIMRGTVEGRPLDALEVTMYAFVMFLAGMDTTSGLFGNALVELDRRPDLRRRLIEDRSLFGAATEEFLRRDTPSQGLARTVTRDTTFFGQRLSAGDSVLMMFAAANRDPEVFDRPHEIDLDRQHYKHFAFGIGAHRCLGANLARTMFRVMLDEVLTRLPDFRVTGPGERFADSGEIHALRSLPIAFSAGARRGTA